MGLPRIRLIGKPGRLVVPRSFYTILVVPHARSGFRKLRVSRGFVWAVGAVVAASVVAGLTAPHLLFRVHTQGATLEVLAQENALLRDDRDHLEARIGELAERLSSFEQQAGRIASALGVQGAVLEHAAAGGPVEAAAPPAGGRRAWVDGELDALDSRTERLDGSLTQLGEAFEQRMSLLASTPQGMPTRGWFSHGYGWRQDPFDGSRQFHRGIDIVADRGSPIVATADGIVTRAVRVADYGKTLDISHGHGYVTRYAHMNEILVQPGQRVRRGDVIGRVGSTGRSTGPHVHYEVFRDGRRVNPWKFLGQ